MLYTMRAFISYIPSSNQAYLTQLFDDLAYLSHVNTTFFPTSFNIDILHPEIVGILFSLH